MPPLLTAGALFSHTSESTITIDENNDIGSNSWIVYRQGIVAKLTSEAVFTTAEDITGHFLM